VPGQRQNGGEGGEGSCQWRETDAGANAALKRDEFNLAVGLSRTGFSLSGLNSSSSFKNSKATG
jgi:hypothetical protein